MDTELYRKNFKKTCFAHIDEFFPDTDRKVFISSFMALDTIMKEENISLLDIIFKGPTILKDHIPTESQKDFADNLTEEEQLRFRLQQQQWHTNTVIAFIGMVHNTPKEQLIPVAVNTLIPLAITYLNLLRDIARVEDKVLTIEDLNFILNTVQEFVTQTLRDILIQSQKLEYLSELNDFYRIFRREYNEKSDN